MILQNRGSRISFARRLWTVALATLGCALAFQSVGAQPQLCFPQVTGLPVKTGSSYSFPNNPPIIPSATCTSTSCPTQPEADTGWFNAFRYTVEQGTTVPNQPADGAFQAIAQGSKLYFSFEINGESGTSPNPYDYVVLAFANFPPGGQPPSTGAVYTWITLSGPFAATASNLPQAVPPGNISVWQSNDPTSWGKTVSTGPFPWLQAGMSAAVDPVSETYSWWVVVSIDNSVSGGPQIPTSGQFPILVDLIRGDGVSLTDEQSTFNVASLAATSPDASNPALTVWPIATLSSSGCSGVSISSGDITNTIAGTPTDNVSYTNPNTFQVKVHNSGAVAADQITATFKIADFGLPAPNNWQVLGFDVCSVSPTPAGCSGTHSGDPVANNPVTGVGMGANLPAAVTTPTGSCADGTGNQCATIAAGAWTLGASNAAFYKFDDNQHQCVRADLASMAGGVTFVHNSAWNNFQFSATASKFTGSAKVSAEYPAVGASGQQTFRLGVKKRPMNGEAGQKILANVGRKAADSRGGDVSNYLSYVVEGCRFNGQTLKVPKHETGTSGNGYTKEFITLNDCDGVGSYGYLVRHDGPVDTWNSNLTASGDGVSLKVSATDANTFTLTIPQGQVVQVVTNVNPSTGTGTGGGTRSGGNGFPVWWWLILLLIVLIVLLLLFRRKKP
jgi:hypothetical protein